MANTIKHQGIVENINGSHLQVRIIQTSACASCSVKGHCTSADTKEKLVDVADANAASYQPGINESNTLATFIEQYKGYIILAGVLLVVLVAGFIVAISYSVRLNLLKRNLEKSEAQLREEKKVLELSEHNLLIANS